jgi:dsRNA-specific ribonuclease
MSHYHNPLYSISYGERDDGIVFYNGVQYWSPKFDKYKFITNFENHSNLQKRSKLLKSSVEAINGTLFLGDGSWGTTNS